MDMALDCKGDSEGKGDGKEDMVADLKGGIGHISSPRKRLEQVRRQAKAIDEEVSKGVRECWLFGCLTFNCVAYVWIQHLFVQNARVDAHHITQDITKNFVHDVIMDSIGFLSSDKK